MQIELPDQVFEELADQQAESERNMNMKRPDGWKHRAKAGTPSSEDRAFNEWQREQEREHVDRVIDR